MTERLIQILAAPQKAEAALDDAASALQTEHGCGYSESYDLAYTVLKALGVGVIT